MSFGGFGKSSGPTAPLKAQPTFGYFSQPPSPPLSNPPFPTPSAPTRSPSPRTFSPYEGSRPPSPFDNSRLATGPPRPAAGPPRASVAPIRAASLRWDRQSSLAGDVKGPIQKKFPSAGPRDHGTSISSKAISLQDLDRTQSPPVQYADDFLNSDNDGKEGGAPLQWGDRQSSFTRYVGGPIQKRSPSPGLHGGGTSTSSKVYQFQGPDRSRPPPVQYTDDFLNYDSDGKEGAATLGWGDRQSSLAGDDGGPIRKRSALSGPRDLGTSISSRGYRFQEPERTRSPPVQYTDDILNPDTDGEDGASLSPLNSRISTDVLGMTKIQYNQRSSASADGMNGGNNVNKVVSHTVSKRNRSPPASATGQILLTHIHSSEDDAERELQAKAKRLARFKTELVETEPIDSTKFAPNVPRKKISLAKADQEKKKSSVDYPSRLMEDSSQDFDNEDMQSCSVIVGLCPDMCPESERAERERKGDLDKYERLDGDRNQTSKTLAVKKYNRTAEREAELIRPMPILQKTMAYLLGLLDQPYDDRFLGLYNFLWDRMRAIRMDLRMQHIFNLEAITMLEQMIRLHVVAMHELCEFSKGEGFSEGFDAHLNIEQMNKTSVELFQLYDDHRKRGILIPTEKEFRGYYALLKLDKHPGYKVEPAELSLDLAKMTAKIRQTHEVLFARDVARSCRTGNFIAFFRHARKGSYLQACLMHAHFSKLRTQALASLHSGLQYNQGLPVSHIANWLGMEGEDIESLLEYHGFSIKEYEEPYMVKEGPFLNADKDYPTRCSILVHGKKSKTILEDILSSRQGIPSPRPFKKEAQLDKNEKQATVPPKRTKTPIVSEEAMVMETISSPKDSLRVQSALEKSVSMHAEPILETLIIGQASIQNHPRASISSPKSQIATPNPFASFPSHSVPQQPSPVTPADSLLVLNNDQLNRKSPAPYNVPVPPSVPDAQPPLFEWARETSFGLDRSTPVSSPGVVVHLELKATQPEIVSRNEGQWMPNASEVDYGVASSPQDDAIMEVSREEFLDERQEVTADDDDANYYNQEVAEAKLKLLIRLWKRRSARKREIREQNRLAADAALSSLSLGPPIRQIKDKSLPYRKLNVDQMVSERYEKLQQSWARWNVSDIVASKLTEKNTNSNCICWKVISYTWLNGGHGDLEARNIVNRLSLDQWLRYKLIPAQEDASASDLVMSGPGLSIWSKWVSDDSNAITCCLSVIKDLESRHYEKKLDGASALLFPLSETLPLEHQKAELHNLVMCLPAGARMPLLILSGFSEAHVEETPGNIIDKLGLDDFDSSRVGSFKIICLKESEGVDRTYGYFNDQKLKEGLIWLASASHPQPVLYNVTMRELVSSHLKTCLDALAMMSSDTTGPNQCISAFNEALDRSINNIVAAASSNPTGWPCPEVFLLDDTTAEFRAVRLFLPSLGWSSSEEVGPLISALRSCKLPSFSYDISWLNRGCSIMQDFESQRQLLQDSLISYLTQSSNVINWMMASRETDVILKRCVRLELHDAEYKLVPNWLHIFRRVINWQLQRISSITRKAYVSEQPQTTSNPLLFEKSDFEASAPYFIDHPSLDEMFEVSCSPIVSKRVKSSPKYFQDRSLVSSIRNASGIPMFNLEEEQNQQSQVQPIYDSDVYMERNDSEVVPKPEKDPDKLSRLLEQCNVLQDDIEKKLSIYF